VATAPGVVILIVSQCSANIYKFFGLVALFACAIVFAQPLTSVAVLPSDGTAISNEELEELTDETRKAALKVLPTNTFILLKQDVVVKRLGGAENYIRVCSESSCIVDLGKQAQVDYVAQASVVKLGDSIRLKVELYNVRTEGLIGICDGKAKNIGGLLDIVEKRAPTEVFGKIPGALGSSKTFSIGIGSVQTADGDYEFEGKKRYFASITSEPSGASLSFNGLPDAKCTKTPCNVELYEGSVRIIANLEQYEMADTTVSIKQNKQGINIKLKPNFGVLDIKPAYQDRVGEDKQWNLSINDKPYSFGEIRLSPNKYAIKLRHDCYEDIDFEAGMNKGSHEVFDMARYVALKKGGLDLSAEADGEPVSEPVFVNGRRVGETPFSGTVPVCSKIEIGENREAVNVIIEHKAAKVYRHQMSTEEMKRRARVAEEERQTAEIEEARRTAWMVGLAIGGEVSFNMKEIYPNFELGGQYNMNVEFYKQNFNLFRFGINLGLGAINIDKEKVRETYPTAKASASYAKINALVRLYPVDFLFLSGGAGYAWYSFDSKEEGYIVDTSTPIFPIGGGVILNSGNGRYGVIEVLYSIVPFKGRTASYMSVIIELKVDF